MTTAYTGAQTSYTDTDPQVRCIEELIHNVSPSATPLTKLIGLSSLNNPAVFSTKYEWMEDTLDPVSALVSTVSTTNGTQITLTTTTDSKFFRVGHIVELDSELMWVSASDYAGVLTVTRDFAGTTGATHATGTEVKIVGIAMIEGADAPTGFTLDIATNYNYTQIFEDVVKVTGTQGSVKNYGFSNSAEYQMEKKFKSLAVLIERALFHGYRDAGSASAPRAMGGIPQYITDNLTAMSTTALTEKVVMDAMQSCFTDVGQEFMPNLLVCNGKQNLPLKNSENSVKLPYGGQYRAEPTAIAA